MNPADSWMYTGASGPPAGSHSSTTSTSYIPAYQYATVPAGYATQGSSSQAALQAQQYSVDAGQYAQYLQQGTSSSDQREKRHKTTPEEATHKCHICGKLFGRTYNYKAHMETHDPSRDYPHACQVEDCDKRFVRKTDLKRHHESVHDKQRNFQCPLCGNLFARKDTLQRHMEDGCARRFEVNPNAIGHAGSQYGGGSSTSYLYSGAGGQSGGIVTSGSSQGAYYGNSPATTQSYQYGTDPRYSGAYYPS